MDCELRRRPLRFVLIPLALVGAAYVGLGLWIGGDVRAVARGAQARFGGDPVTALAALAADPAAPLGERNRAVWALGQLGDPAALPVLERLHADAACRHDGAICQHEVRKALAACRGGFNLTAIVWRHAVSG